MLDEINKILMKIADTSFKKETLAQVFSCGFCEIFKITFFTEYLWTIASVFWHGDCDIL